MTTQERTPSHGEGPLPGDDDRATGAIRIGQPIRDRRDILGKLGWIAVWLIFLAPPVRDLLSDRHSDWADAAGWLGLAVFVGTYLLLILRNMVSPRSWWLVGGILVTLAALALTLSLTLGPPWLVLFVYVSVGCGSTLPLRLAYWAIPATAAAMVATGVHLGGKPSMDLIVPALLSGSALTGIRQLVRTTAELRRARATVAHLAANEERLRLARDLHDLLGHSLSLITLKSELAGRMLAADHPDQAARHAAAVEQVSRQALVDVREAVTGYRRPRLAAELAGAQVALTAAGVTAQLPAEPDLTGVPEEQESALAWALREAVTNVVRHSGARRCTVEVLRRETLDGPMLQLVVQDDGSGGSGTPGNGLTGLTERLAKAGGHLEAGRAPQRGFRLVARVPVTAAATARNQEGDPVGSGT
ncbi:putative signal transduction histidine kinase [Actinobacteria bacterium OK074]|nr:putative signal transduction histidine kinase [Actinobacteria bacterium OK074]